MEETAFKKAFGKRLRFLRELRHLTQAKLAEHIGVTEQYISMLERGLSAPSFALISQLSKTLDTHPASLFLFPKLDPAPEGERPGPLPLPTLPENLSAAGIWTVDAKGNETLSAALRRWLPETSTPHTTPSLFPHVPDEDAQKLQAAVEAAREGNPAPLFSFRLEGVRPLRILAYAIPQQNGGVRVVLMDVTEHLRLKQTQLDLQAAVEALAEARTQQLQATVAELEAEVQRRRQSETALATAEAAWRTLFDHAPVGIFQSLPEGRLQIMNREAYSMFGYDSSAEAIAIEDIARQIYVNPERRQDFVHAMARHGQIKDFEMQAKTKDGREFWISVTARSIPSPPSSPTAIAAARGTHHSKDSGQQETSGESYIGFVEDITSRKAVDALLDDLVHMARHEMAGQINVGYNACRILAQDESLSPDQRGLLQEVELAGERALHMLTLARDLVRMEMGLPLEIPAESLPLASTLSRVVEDVRLYFAGLAPAITLQMDPSAKGVQVRGGESLCYALFFNCLKNAVQATLPGEVTTISMGIAEDDDSMTAKQVVVTVQNPGSMDEELATHFFAKHVTSGKKDGAGLGAYIARLIARRLGGDATLTQWRDGHVVLRIVLPVLEPKSVEAGGKIESTISGNGPDA